MSEISAPNTLLRIVGARCEVCGPLCEHVIALSGPVYASELENVWHVTGMGAHAALPTDGRLPVSDGTAKTCGGKVLFATEPIK